MLSVDVGIPESVEALLESSSAFKLWGTDYQLASEAFPEIPDSAAAPLCKLHGLKYLRVRSYKDGTPVYTWFVEKPPTKE